MLGPVLERLHNELLKPYIDVAFDRMIEAQLVPPPPEEMHDQELSVEFVSMLAQAQRAIGVAGVDRLVQTIGTIAVFQSKSGQTPTALDKLAVDETIDAYSDMLGVDPTLIVSNDKVAIVRKQRAQAVQAAQQQAQIAQGAQTAKDLSAAKTDEPNALNDVIQQFSGYGTGVPTAV